MRAVDFIRAEDGFDFRPAVRRALMATPPGVPVYLPPGEYNLNMGTHELLLAGAIVGAPAMPEDFE